MAENDMLKRYLDAGMAFTDLTRKRAEAIVKDLVKAGELQREQTQDRVEEILERSRKNTERLLDLVRKEISDQLSSLGLATRDDLARLEARLTGKTATKAAAGGGASTPTKAGGTSKATDPPTPAKKSAKTAAKKAPAKKAADAG